MSQSKDELLNNEIEMLNLSPRTFFALKRARLAKINIVRDLVAVDFTKLDGIGVVASKEIKQSLKEYLGEHE